MMLSQRSKNCCLEEAARKVKFAAEETVRLYEEINKALRNRSNQIKLGHSEANTKLNVSSEFGSIQAKENEKVKKTPNAKRRKKCRNEGLSKATPGTTVRKQLAATKYEVVQPFRLRKNLENVSESKKIFAFGTYTELHKENLSPGTAKGRHPAINKRRLRKVNRLKHCSDDFLQENRWKLTERCNQGTLNGLVFKRDESEKSKKDYTARSYVTRSRSATERGMKEFINRTYISKKGNNYGTYEQQSATHRYCVNDILKHQRALSLGEKIEIMLKSVIEGRKKITSQRISHCSSISQSTPKMCPANDAGKISMLVSNRSEKWSTPRPATCTCYPRKHHTANVLPDNERYL